VRTTELTAITLARKLTCEHQSLIMGKLVRYPTDEPELVTQQYESFHVGTPVNDLDRAAL
jgi:hypothetical protein